MRCRQCRRQVDDPRSTFVVERSTLNGGSLEFCSLVCLDDYFAAHPGQVTR